MNVVNSQTRPIGTHSSRPPLPCHPGSVHTAARGVARPWYSQCRASAGSLEPAATPATTDAKPTPSSSSSSGSAPSAPPTAAPTSSSTPSATSSSKPGSNTRSAPATTSSSSSSSSSIDWDARRKQRTAQEVYELATKRGVSCTLPAIAAGLQQLEDLIPGWHINLERMKAADWARLALNPGAAAAALVSLKRAYPGADLAAVLVGQPGLLLQEPDTLAANAVQVRQLLSAAKDVDALISALPCLTDPALTISILVTVDKWYFNKRDPVEVIEADPELIARAQACDIPFEPVYIDATTGAWSAPSLNYREKRAPWQAYIDKHVYKQKDDMPGGSTP